MAAVPTVNCDDRANIAADLPLYVWALPGNLIINPAAMVPCSNVNGTAHHRACQSADKRHHYTAAGARINPFRRCAACAVQASHMLDGARRLATHPGPLFPIRGTRDLKFGHNGVFTRGHLCNICVADEIEAYYRRRYVDGRIKTAAQAESTCKCVNQLKKNLCWRDRRDIHDFMQRESDRLAGPGLPPLGNWLEHLDYDPNNRRAVWVQANAALITRRANAGMRRNACRCGRDIPRPPPAQAFNVPAPVAMCTACSGVVVDLNHNMVVNWHQDPVYPPGFWNVREENMTLERTIQ